MTDNKGTSVLASLTADVMGEKVKASKPQLTPVAGEVASSLPNDVGTFMSNERLRDHAIELRKFAAEAVAIADGLDAMVGVAPSTKPVDLDAVRKQKERAADTKASEQTIFDQALAAKAEAAQTAVYDASDAAEPVGWVCPTHGKAVTKTSTSSGRQYRGCPDCNLFER